MQPDENTSHESQYSFDTAWVSMIRARTFRSVSAVSSSVESQKVAEITGAFSIDGLYLYAKSKSEKLERRAYETIKIPGLCFVIFSPSSVSISLSSPGRPLSYRGALFTAHRFLKLSHAASTPSGICITTRESFVIYGGRCHKHGSIDYSFGRSRRYPLSRLQSLSVLAPLSLFLFPSPHQKDIHGVRIVHCASPQRPSKSRLNRVTCVKSTR